MFGAGFTTLESYLCSFDGPETVTSEMTILSIIEGTCTIGFSVAGRYILLLLEVWEGGGLGWEGGDQRVMGQVSIKKTTIR